MSQLSWPRRLSARNIACGCGTECMKRRAGDGRTIIIRASVSEPHIDEKYMHDSILETCRAQCGTSLSSRPHIVAYAHGATNGGIIICYASVHVLHRFCFSLADSHSAYHAYSTSLACMLAFQILNSVWATFLAQSPTLLFAVVSKELLGRWPY